MTLRFISHAFVLALVLPALAPALAPVPAFVGSAKADLASGPLVPPNAAFRTDPDGARTFTGTIEDEYVGGLVHRVLYDRIAEENGDGTVSLVAVAHAVASAAACEQGLCPPGDPGPVLALASGGCAALDVEPVCYTGPYDTTVDAIGVYASDWSYDGAPMTTLGVYVDTTTDGRFRFPVAIVENLPGLSASLAPLFDLVLQDVSAPLSAAAPFVAHWALPASIAWPLAAGVLIIGGAAAFGAILGAEALPSNVPETGLPVQSQMEAVWAQMFPYFGPPAGWFLFFTGLHAGASMIYHQEGSWHFSLFWAEYSDRPDVYVWTSRKQLAGHDLFTGNYLARDGSYASTGTYCVDFAISGWKTDAVGVAHRLDHVTTQDAGIVVRHDTWMTCNAGLDWDGGDRVSVATEAAGVRTYLAGLDFMESKDGPFGIQPSRQQDDIRFGAYVDGAFVPLFGTRTSIANRPFTDVTNDGENVSAVEHHRETSFGVWATGTYTPVWAARYDGERASPDAWALRLATTGVGDQTVGDWEVSTGTYLNGTYFPITGSRYDDELPGHHHAYRAMVSWGIYVLGDYTPLAAITYDGELPLGACCVGAPETTNYIVSAGSFVNGAYVPLVGLRHSVGAPGGSRAVQQTFEAGVFLADYQAFVPLVVVAHDGDTTLASWALANPALFVGNEGDFDAQLGTSSPLSGYTPLVGLQYRDESATQFRTNEAFVVVGVYANGAFVPLAGASVAGNGPWINTAVGQPTPIPDGVAPWVVTTTLGTVPKVRIDAGPAVFGYDPLVCLDLQSPQASSPC